MDDNHIAFHRMLKYERNRAGQKVNEQKSESNEMKLESEKIQPHISCLAGVETSFAAWRRRLKLCFFLSEEGRGRAEALFCQMLQTPFRRMMAPVKFDDVFFPDEGWNACRGIAGL
jgi:hypothetical protein